MVDLDIFESKMQEIHYLELFDEDDDEDLDHEMHIIMHERDKMK